MLTAFIGSLAFVIAGPAGEAGALGWTQGELSRNYRQPLATAWEGVKYALGVLKLAVEEQKINAYYGEIVVSSSDDETATISLEKWTNTETRISVRVGGVTDRALTGKIHEEIEKALR